jgi:N,N'-diacetyllegionaminate synthase
MSGRLLFLIPARGGSRRVPGKNLRVVGGIPLVGWAVRHGLAAARSLDGGPHRVACSTDDEAVASAAESWGAAVIHRPAALATETASSVDVALHALDSLEVDDGRFEALVLLQPTSPLTDPADIVAAVARYRRSGGTPVVGVAPSHPATWHYAMPAADGPLVAATTVDGAELLLAGAFFVISPAELRATRRFVQPGRALGHAIPAETAIDVDDERDLVAAEAHLAARPVRPIRLGRAMVGEDRVLVIAEAGVNHNGDVAMARRLIEAAAGSGADAVKFQTFEPAALAATGAPTAIYQREAGVEAADQRGLLERLVLPDAAWAELQEHAQQLGLMFLSTPFDDRSAELLDGLRVPAFKVGSGELTNLPFIARLARRGRPLLISTGMADMIEVAAAVDAVRAAADVPLALFHCVSSYPAAPEDANLRAIETLRRAFAVPVGWSDHTPGIAMSLAAVASGASIIEKHLTLDRALPGPDHRASLEPLEFAALVAGIRAVEAAIGTGLKRQVPAERDVAAVARRSLHWAVSLPAGHVVIAADVAILRPGTGLAPARLPALVGRPLARDVDAGSLVRAEDVAGGLVAAGRVGRRQGNAGANSGRVT